nr:sensor histidine kinase [uncultured Sphingomonas sp.]
MHARSGGEGITLDVADDGPGIPTADRKRIFEPFFTSRRAIGGTDLGLPIVRSLLASIESSIELQEGSAGACFVLGLHAASLDHEQTEPTLAKRARYAPSIDR